MYTLQYTDDFWKLFKKLPQNIQRRIISTLERIRLRPHSFLVRLVGSLYYRLRVGDYRIIVDIKDDRLIIFVLEVGHRERIYRQ